MKRSIRVANFIAFFLTCSVTTEALLMSRLKKSQIPTHRPTTTTASVPNSPPLNYGDGIDESTSFVSQGTAAVDADSERSQRSILATGADLDLIRTVFSQETGLVVSTLLLTLLATILTGHSPDLNSLHWTGTGQFFSILDMRATPMRIVEGITSAIPLIYLSNALQNNPDRHVIQMNLGATDQIFSLFGRMSRREHVTTEPETPMIHTLALSAALALCAGVSEEIVFRGVVPAFLEHQTHSVSLALGAQSILYGLAHVNLNASLGENRVVSSHQALNGLIQGATYILTGGDLLPCIISHTLYDFHVFMQTLMSINEQIDYSEKGVVESWSSTETDGLLEIKREAPSALTPEVLASIRRLYFVFDQEHKGSLSEMDVQKAATYSFLLSSDPPSTQRVRDVFTDILESREDGDQPDRLHLHEFVRLLLVLKNQPFSV